MLISKEDFERASNEAGLDLERSIESATSMGRSRMVPSDCGQRISVAKLIVEQMLKGELCLFIREWGVWPSSECEDMVEQIRKNAGISGPTIESRYERITSSDVSYASALVAALIVNTWDFVLLTPSLGAAIHVSHDEFMSAIAGDPGFHESFDAICDSHGLPVFLGFTT